ncbi:MAG: GDSL-type esterase/lipase family protein [Bacteroidota bacterium]
MRKLAFITSIIFLLASCSHSGEPETEAIEEEITVTLQEFMSEDSSVLHAFDVEIAAFRAMDRDSMPPEGAWLFVGSSSFRFWENIAENLAPHPVINRGFGGSNMVQLVHYMDSIVFPYKPSHIFIYEGDNDIVEESTSPEAVKKAVLYFVNRVKEEMPGVSIHFVAVKPSPSRKHLLRKAQLTNALLAEEAERIADFYFIDVATAMMVSDDSIRGDIFISDNLHMNQEGYDIWSEIILTHMNSFQ